MKDVVTPVAAEEVRLVIKKCLEQAALVNYTRISEYAHIEGNTSLHLVNSPTTPEKLWLSPETGAVDLNIFG